MGLFSKLTDAIKDAAPVIGGTIGFGLGGPMGAAIGSGIGGLVAGQDVEDALKTAAIGGALGYGASKMGATPFLQGSPGTAVTQAPALSPTSIVETQAATVDPGMAAGQAGVSNSSFFD